MTEFIYLLAGSIVNLKLNKQFPCGTVLLFDQIKRGIVLMHMKALLTRNIAEEVCYEKKPDFYAGIGCLR